MVRHSLLLFFFSPGIIIHMPPFQYHEKSRYPKRGSSCPDNQGAVNPEAEDEAWFANPYPQANYYFPDFEKNSCVSTVVL
jgi:hypothetical protein